MEPHRRLPREAPRQRAETRERVHRTRLVEAAEGVARALTPLIVVCAVAAGFWQASPWVALAVLVATCPCALARRTIDCRSPPVASGSLNRTLTLVTTST